MLSRLFCAPTEALHARHARIRGIWCRFQTHTVTVDLGFIANRYTSTPHVDTRAYHGVTRASWYFILNTPPPRSGDGSCATRKRGSALAFRGGRAATGPEGSGTDRTAAIECP